MLQTVVFFPSDSWRLVPAFNEDDLPKLFDLVCELYGDVSIRDFDDFWDFFEADEGLVWRKEVGDNEIKINLKSYVNVNSVYMININKKAWADWAAILSIKDTLWGSADVSLEENIASAETIIKGTAVPIKSCYIIKGALDNIQELENTPELPDSSELLSNIKRDILTPYKGIYSSAKITDASGTIDIITRSPTNSERQIAEYKYFLVYEYMTDEGRAFFLVGWARSNPEEE